MIQIYEHVLDTLVFGNFKVFIHQNRVHPDFGGPEFETHTKIYITRMKPNFKTQKKNGYLKEITCS